MKQRQLSEVFQDILDAIGDIESFTASVDFEAFQTNREKVLAVVKAIEILGEAVKKVPDVVRNQYSDVPWKSIAGMRDILVHEYWSIDTSVVWATAQEELPPLKARITEIAIDVQENRSD